MKWLSDGSADIIAQVKSCTICEKYLPFKPRPIIQVSEQARLLIIGQAPGIKAHESNKPWNDASGKVLRHWLGISENVFYNPTKVALMPMGFCYPGKGKNGDLPPRPECSKQWHTSLLNEMKNIKLIILIGMYAQKYYLTNKAFPTLTKNIQAYKTFLPQYFALAHPSPRNKIWLMKNPWFVKEVIPELQKLVQNILNG